MQIWQLEKLLRKMVMADGSQDQMDQASTSLAKTMVPSSHRSPMQKRIHTTVELIHENWKRIWVLTLWGIANFGLFMFKFIQYRNREVFEVMGYCVCIAKGAAETTKLNMALILLPVCRNTLTSLRSTVLSTVVPFDDNINFHKVHSLPLPFPFQDNGITSCIMGCTAQHGPPLTITMYPGYCARNCNWSEYAYDCSPDLRLPKAGLLPK